MTTKRPQTHISIAVRGFNVKLPIHLGIELRFWLGFALGKHPLQVSLCISNWTLWAHDPNSALLNYACTVAICIKCRNQSKASPFQIFLWQSLSPGTHVVHTTRSKSITFELPTLTVPLAVFPLKEWITSQHVTFLVHYLISHLLSKSHMKKIQPQTFTFSLFPFPSRNKIPSVSGSWVTGGLGGGPSLSWALVLSTCISTRARALQRAPQPPHLGYNGYKQGLSWESSSRLELSDSKDRASRATRPIFSRPINMSDFLY